MTDLTLERGPTAIRYRCDCGWAGTPRPYGDTTRTIHTEATRHMARHHKPTPQGVGWSAPHPHAPGADQPPHQEEDAE